MSTSDMRMGAARVAGPVVGSIQVVEEAIGDGAANLATAAGALPPDGGVYQAEMCQLGAVGWGILLRGVQW